MDQNRIIARVQAVGNILRSGQVTSRMLKQKATLLNSLADELERFE